MTTEHDYTVMAFDASNDTHQNFDVWGVVNSHGELVFVATTEARCYAWGRRMTKPYTNEEKA